MMRFRRKKRVDSCGGRRKSSWRKSSKPDSNSSLRIIDGGKKTTSDCRDKAIFENAKTLPLLRFNSDDSFNAYSFVDSQKFLYIQKLSRDIDKSFGELSAFVESVEFRDFEILRQIADIQNVHWVISSNLNELLNSSNDDDLFSVQIQNWLKKTLALISSIYIPQKISLAPVVLRGDDDV